MAERNDPPKPRRPKNPKFRTFTEVLNLTGFVLDRPFSKGEYKDTVGDYNGEGLEFICHLIKGSGRVCRTPHDWGYVVELIDGTLTNIGNECIYKELGRQDTMLAGVEKYRKTRNREENLKGIQAEVSQVDTRIQCMEQYDAQLRKIEQYVAEFAADYGEELVVELSQRARTQRSVVNATATRVKYVDDGSGDLEPVVRSFPFTLGSIKGLELFGSNRLSNTRYLLDTTMEHYRSFSLDLVPDEPDDTFTARMRYRFKGYDRLEFQMSSLLKDYGVFKANNPQIFACLFRDHHLRTKIIRAYYKQEGQPISTEQASKKLDEIDRVLAKSQDATYIE